MQETSSILLESATRTWPGPMVLFLSAVMVVLTAYHFWFNSLRYAKLGNKIPTAVYTLPFIGDAWIVLFQRTPAAIMKFVLSRVDYKKHDVVRVWLGPYLVVGLLKPKDIELILGSNEHLEKSREYKLFEPWLGNGLLISKGELWSSHRKMIAPTFHTSILKTFVPVFNKNADRLVECLKKELGAVFDVHDYMSGTTVDILLETAMGVKKTDEDNTGYEYAKAVMDMCNILHQRHYKFWLRPDFLFNFTRMASLQQTFLNIIHGLSDKVIRRKTQEYEDRKLVGESSSMYSQIVENNKFKGADKEYSDTYIRDDLDEIEENDVGEKRRLAFLDFMVEASRIPGNNLSDKEIRNEVNTIMFEGHDTTAAASSFVLCLLGIHHNIQDRVVQELDSILGSEDRPITFNDTLEMHYLERVIKETLRLYPPVPVISRQINRELKLTTNYVLPAGTTVLISPYVIHRNSEYYSNPTQFNPDNFLPEVAKKRDYYSFIPFSAGPRSCVGRKYAMLKLKIILAKVLRKYKVTSVVNEDKFELQSDIILKRTDGFRLIIDERHRN